MIYISVIITHILHIANQAGPSVWAAIPVLHSGHVIDSKNVLVTIVSSQRFLEKWRWHFSDISEPLTTIVIIFVQLPKTLSWS